eukprot:10768990-Ditylum_brightwellii.AAC.1
MDHMDEIDTENIGSRCKRYEDNGCDCIHNNHPRLNQEIRPLDSSLGGKPIMTQFQYTLLAHLSNGENLDDMKLDFIDACSMNNCLWDRNAELQDNGTVAIGKKMHPCALTIQNVMSGDVPMIKTAFQIIVMKHQG